MNTVFSNNLKKFRQQKNLTQEQAAEMLNVSPHTVSRWECNTTLPDVPMLPQIAKLYCVTIDDLFKETSVAYENYAQRLASVYESTRRPEDFIAADYEFQKLLKSESYSTEDLRIYGILHHYMMRYCMNRAIDLFDKVIGQGKDAGENTFWRTKHQKMLLYSQIGKGQESIDAAQQIINEGSEDPEDWICLIAAYKYSGNKEKAYEWFSKALPEFPDKAALYIFGGDVCKDLKKYDEAFKCWRKALELDSEMDDARYSMGFCYEELGEYDKAYDIWLAIARDLEKDGYEVEKNYPFELAGRCREILEKKLQRFPENTAAPTE